MDTQRQCIDEGFNFIPMVLEAVGGGWGPSASKVFLEIAKTKSQLTGESKNKVLTQIHQNLGTILHRENARAVLRRCTITSADAAQVLASAAILQSAAAEQAAP